MKLMKNKEEIITKSEQEIKKVDSDFTYYS